MVKKFLTTFLLLTASVWAQDVLPTHTQTLARAIAQAEGFYVKGSLPNRLHNPGDIRTRIKGAYYGQTSIDRRGYVVFKNDKAGFAALEMQLDRIADDKSAHYSTDMTIAAFARVYVGGPGWYNWARIVAKVLGVTTSTTLDEYLNGNQSVAHLEEL